MAHHHLREGRVVIEQTDRLGHFNRGEYVTVDFSFWQYIVERGALTIVEGFHKKEEIEQIMRASRRSELNQEERPSHPKFISFTCRAGDLVNFAREIIKTYEKPTSET